VKKEEAKKEEYVRKKAKEEKVKWRVRQAVSSRSVSRGSSRPGEAESSKWAKHEDDVREGDEDVDDDSVA